MRVRIIRPLATSVDGIDLSKFLEGVTYDVGTTLGNYLLSQRWAVPAGDELGALSLSHAVARPPILIVDDDHDMRVILEHLLEHHGWPSQSAADGVAGLQALKRHRPSLILLDLAMPRMDGVAFRNAQRQLPDRRLASVPVVVVSAVHDASEYKARLNAADVLMKPFEADRLLQAVDNYARPPSLFRW